MSVNKTEISYALLGSDLISSSEAEKKELFGTKFICPIETCNHQISLTKSHTRNVNGLVVNVSSFFSHNKSGVQNHSYANMTLLHQRCRDVFASYKPSFNIENDVINITSAIVETKVDSLIDKGWRPDIKCTRDNGEEFAVEIRVTNKKTPEDIKKFSLPTIEIDCNIESEKINLSSDEEVLNLLKDKLAQSEFEILVPFPKTVEQKPSFDISPSKYREPLTFDYINKNKATLPLLEKELKMLETINYFLESNEKAVLWEANRDLVTELINARLSLIK